MDLHEQFSWPYLDNLPPSTIKWIETRNDDKDIHNTPWHRRSSLLIPPQQKKIVSKREEELRF